MLLQLRDILGFLLSAADSPEKSFIEAFGNVNLLQPICAVGKSVSRMSGRSVSVWVSDSRKTSLWCPAGDKYSASMQALFVDPGEGILMNF